MQQVDRDMSWIPEGLPQCHKGARIDPRPAAMNGCGASQRKYGPCYQFCGGSLAGNDCRPHSSTTSWSLGSAVVTASGRRASNGPGTGYTIVALMVNTSHLFVAGSST